MQVFYKVRQGDTLFSIARRFGIPLDSLIAANNILYPFVIFLNQQLSLPSGTNTRGNGIPYYTVRFGDTYFNIAKRYNVVTNGVPRYDLLAAENKNVSLRPGVKLVVPYAPIGNFGYIAYFAEIDGEFDLFMLDTRTNRSTRLTNGLGDRLSVPFWGQDPKKLAFVGKDGVIFIVDVFVKTISRIDQVEMGTLVSWSNDNTTVVYTKGNTIVIYNTEIHEISYINESMPSYAQWFPNGQEILFESTDDLGIYQLYRINIDGTGKRKITNNTEGRFNEVRISNDGRFILYTTPGASVSLIRTINLSTGRVYEITGGPLGKNYNPDWSPDSQRIAYSASIFENGRYFSQIRIVDRQGKNDKVLAIASCFSSIVSWAPDNRKIAYLSDCGDEGLASEIWVVDMLHPAPIRLVSGKKIASLAWSP